MNANLRKYLFLLLILPLSGCHLVQYVPQDKLLLRDEVSLKGNKSISLYSAVKTKPNKRIVWPKFYLSLYNMGVTLERDSSALKTWYVGKPERKQFFDNTVNWLTEEIGEPPVIVNEESIRKDSLNIINAYAAAGFFDTKASYEIRKIDNYFERRRGKVTFDITEGQPFHIRKIWIKAPFEELEQHFVLHKNKSNILVGERFSYNKLALERARFANLLRTQGFFTFSPNSIQFKVDTFLNREIYPLPEGVVEVSSVNDTLQENVKWLDVVVELTESPERYFISEIEVDLGRLDATGAEVRDNQPKVNIRAKRLTDEQREELRIDQKRLSDEHRMTFLVSPELIRLVNYNLIAERIFFEESAQYDRRDAIYTQQRLQDLPMFQYVLINYDVDEANKRVKVNIQANFAPKYELKAGIEGYTNDISASSSILPIGGISISVRNKNSFRRSVLTELTFGGNIGLYGVNETTNALFGQAQGKLNYTFPKFIFPFPKTLIPAKYRNFSVLRPVTIAGISGIVENRQEFTQRSFSGNFNWRYFNQPQSQREQTEISWLSFEYIDFSLDSTFQKDIELLEEALQRNYQSRFNAWHSASYTVSDYLTTSKTNTYFGKGNVEIGGFIPRAFERIFEGNTIDNQLNIREDESLSYGQYAKLWIEGKTQVPLKNGKLKLVLRGVVGGAHPFGQNWQTQLVPVERRFFAGGPSSMRGWQSRTLGPGTLPLTDLLKDTTNDISSLLAMGGEYLFETNAELRFHVWSYMDMAIFTDVGNVWLNRKDTAVQDIDFNILKKGFITEGLALGWDAGVGFRFDFDFLIIRIDLAQQLFDPGRLGDGKNGWVLRDLIDETSDENFRLKHLRKVDWSEWNTFQVNVGIGYPF